MTYNKKTLKNVVDGLKEIGDGYKILGDKWRAKTYSNASKIIKNGGSADEYGIGESVRMDISMLEYGKVPKRLEELRQQVKIIMNLEKVMGIGPTAAKRFVKMGAKNIMDLKEPRFAKLLTNMQKLGLEHLDDLARRIPRETVRKIANTIMKNSGIVTWNLVGSWRRGNAYSSDVDILISGKVFPSIQKKAAFVSYIVNGTKRKSFLWRDSNQIVRQVDMRLVSPQAYPAALLYFTGSREFNITIRSQAKKSGYKLNEYGLFTDKNEQVPIQSEEDIFKKLGLRYIEPKLRD